MSEILSKLTDPIFFIPAFLITFIGAFFVAYLIRLVDAVLARFSKNRKAKKEQEERDIILLSENPTYLLTETIVVFFHMVIGYIIIGIAFSILIFLSNIRPHKGFSTLHGVLLSAIILVLACFGSITVVNGIIKLFKNIKAEKLYKKNIINKQKKSEKGDRENE